MPTKIMDCKLKIIKGIPTLEAIVKPEIHSIQMEGVFIEQWFINLCKELPDLRCYNCIDDLYDELGKY